MATDQDSSREQTITAKVTIEGNPESILRDLNAMRANTKRAVQIVVELRRPPYGWIDPHWLPQIVNGDANATNEHFVMLCRQGRLSRETEERLARLIDEFKRLTE